MPFLRSAARLVDSLLCLAGRHGRVLACFEADILVTRCVRCNRWRDPRAGFALGPKVAVDVLERGGVVLMQSDPQGLFCVPFSLPETPAGNEEA